MLPIWYCLEVANCDWISKCIIHTFYGFREKRLAKKYYDKLFKEYCIADLSRYKENKVCPMDIYSWSSCSSTALMFISHHDPQSSLMVLIGICCLALWDIILAA